MGSDLDIEYGPERAVNGVTRRLADTSAAKRGIGFEAEIGLEAGLAQLVEWWRAEKALDRAPVLAGSEAH
jgi:UDP-glucose 4-epimerase